MSKRPFFWNILPLFIVLTLISGGLLYLFAVNEFRNSYTDSTRERLKEDAISLRETVLYSEIISDSKLLNLIKKISKESKIRYTIINLTGKVIADNKKTPADMDNHRDRPEVIKAFNGKVGSEIRYSETLKRDFMYVAVPVTNEKEQFIVRASLPLITLKESIGRFSVRLSIVALFILIIAVILSVIVSRRVAKPLEILTLQAERFANGELLKSYRSYPNLETEKLANSMNTMAIELDKKIEGLEYRKNIQRAVFSSMHEGVVAVDSDDRIILANRSALEILEIVDDNILGKFLQEVIRNSRVQKFVTKLMKKNQQLEKEVVVITTNEQDRHIQLYGATLKDEFGSGKGAVFVMHDISELKRNEQMRREFVANVSHELRTPLTAIKGFVETLTDGALNKREDANHFLSIISKNVDRLNSITEDLLTLSKLERNEISNSLDLKLVSMEDLFQTVTDVCKSKADQKNIKLKLVSGYNVDMLCEKDSFEQALINIVDNAIKYSNSDTEIKINCQKARSVIWISVTDEGAGIAPIHLSRLFERFYRVDKARSRTVGGTGLGLSIVKHIMSSHNGKVTVESKLGEGSKFILTLPIEKKDENNV